MAEEYGKISKTTMTAIADAIREKTGNAGVLTPGQMASEIANIVVLPANAYIVYSGKANCETTLCGLFESSAVGALGE